MFKMDWSCTQVAGRGHGVPNLTCIPDLVALAVNWLLAGAGTVALFMIIYSGIKFINSGGDPKSIDSARKTFLYSLLGLILIFASFAIVNLIGRITGVSGLGNFSFK